MGSSTTSSGTPRSTPRERNPRGGERPGRRDGEDRRRRPGAGHPVARRRRSSALPPPRRQARGGGLRTGLGLTIAGTSRAPRGDVRLFRSERGARFEVTLSGPGGHPMKVLVAEDDAHTRNGLRRSSGRGLPVDPRRRRPRGPRPLREGAARLRLPRRHDCPGPTATRCAGRSGPAGRRPHHLHHERRGGDRQVLGLELGPTTSS